MCFNTCQDVTKSKRRNLHKAILDFHISWKSITPEAMAPTITQRYSHNAVVHENSMYVFGGCTAEKTTFNDLWRLDLSKRQWVRLLTVGKYPSPKACSTMVCYKDYLGNFVCVMVVSINLKKNGLIFSIIWWMDLPTFLSTSSELASFQ